MPDDSQAPDSGTPDGTPGEDTATAPPGITSSGGLRLPLPTRKDGQ